MQFDIYNKWMCGRDIPLGNRLLHPERRRERGEKEGGEERGNKVSNNYVIVFPNLDYFIVI